MTVQAGSRPDRLERPRQVVNEAVYAALAGLAALTSAGIWLLMIVDEGLSVGAATVQMVVKFTNLTVLLVAGVAAWIATGRSPGEFRTVAHLSAIVMAVVTSVVNVALLDASLPSGWWGIVDLSQHYLVPAAVVTSWAVLGPSVVLRSSALGLVLLVPLGWLIFVFGRGAATGSYPYDFLDVPASGWASVLGVVGMILVFMLALTVGANAIDRRREQGPRSGQTHSNTPDGSPIGQVMSCVLGRTPIRLLGRMPLSAGRGSWESTWCWSLTVPGSGNVRREVVVVLTRQNLVRAGLIVASVATWCGVVVAGDADLDTSFGDGGIATFDGSAASLSLQEDGRIVVAGSIEDDDFDYRRDVMVRRFNADGAPDVTFGSDGVVTTDVVGLARPVGPKFDRASDVAVQPDGKIVVAGLRYGENSPVLLARYEADGSLDPSFGRDGATVTSFDQPSRGNSVVVRADGSIVVAGILGIGRVDGPPRSHLVLRYDDAGELDATFGTDGVVVTALTDRGSGASEARLQTDGKLVVADFSGAVVRYGTEAGLRPLAGAPLSTSDGFRFVITNYDPSYDWTVTTTAGQAAIDSDGVVVVTGIGPGATATVTVTASRPGHETASTEVTGSSLPDELPATGSGTPLAVIAVLAILLGALLAGVAHPQQRHTERSRFRTR